jgi:hypothetical protein
VWSNRRSDGQAVADGAAALYRSHLIADASGALYAVELAEG